MALEEVKTYNAACHNATFKNYGCWYENVLINWDLYQINNEYY